jgi:hypothetical protein
MIHNIVQELYNTLVLPLFLINVIRNIVMVTKSNAICTVYGIFYIYSKQDMCAN